MRIADGTLIPCEKAFRGLQWSVQEHQFQSDFLVMPLPFYDMILGLDWLSLHSPMQIDWLHKWLLIPLGDAVVRLQGQLFELPTGSVIQIAPMFAEAPVYEVASLPAAVSQLIDEFQSVFAPLVGYPPA